jgi:hypothetical protein
MAPRRRGYSRHHGDAAPQGTMAARPDDDVAPQGSGDTGSFKAQATPRRGLLHGVVRQLRGPTTVVNLQDTTASWPDDGVTSQGTTTTRLLKRGGLL